MHNVSGRWKLGLALSLITAVLWGLLPIAMKGLLQQMDAVTVTWYRFATAAMLVMILLLSRKRIPKLSSFKGKTFPLCIIATLGLSCNYVFYLYGVELITPSSAQVLIQVAPLMMLLGGLVVFKESFSALQWLGSLFFIVGLALFFNLRFSEIFGSLGDYSMGLIWIIFAAVTWAAYALAQKQLLNNYSSNQIMFVIYALCVPILLPISSLGQIANLDALGWFLLTFCCLNTLVAYGAFAEALVHWEASRVSAILAVTPLFTIAGMKLMSLYFPDYAQAEPVNWISLCGAVLVVTGSILTATAGRKKTDETR